MNNLFTLNQILGYSLLASGLLALPQLSTRWGGYGLPPIARFRPDSGLRTLSQRWPPLGHRCWLILPVVLMLLLWLNGLMLVITRGSGPVARLAGGLGLVAIVLMFIYPRRSSPALRQASALGWGLSLLFNTYQLNRLGPPADLGAFAGPVNGLMSLGLVGLLLTLAYSLEGSKPATHLQQRWPQLAPLALALQLGGAAGLLLLGLLQSLSLLF